MKVILVNDVEHLGRMGDVKEVAPGYARNYLLPKRMVVPATAGQLKQLDVLRARRAKEEVRRLSESQTMGDRIGGLEVLIAVRAGEQGRLFGSVTNQDVAAALKEQHGIEIDRRDVEVGDPIRSLGTHSVTVRLGGQVQASLRLNVVEEGQTGTTTAAPAGSATAATAAP